MRRFLNISDTAVGHGRDVLESSPLGTCVAVLLHDAKRRIGAMAHCLLPTPGPGASGPPGKYVDTAIEHLLDLLQAQEVERPDLVAKLVGGASLCRFEDPNDALHIGQQNLDRAEQMLLDARIPIAGRETGGTVGRRVRFQVATGEAHVYSKRGHTVV